MRTFGIVCVLGLLMLPGLGLAEKGGKGGGKPPKEDPPPPDPDPAIAYVSGPKSCKLSDTWYCSELEVINADGSNKHVVLGAQWGITHLAPDWSPDGTKLVFFSDIRGNGIYTVNKDGNELCRIVPTRQPNVRPDWSPVPLADGSFYIAYMDNEGPPRSVSDLFVVRMPTTCPDPDDPDNPIPFPEPVNLTRQDDPTWYEATPKWDQEGKRLAASRFSPSEYGDVVIYQIEMNAGQPTVVSKEVLTDASSNLDQYDVSVVMSDWANGPDNKNTIVVRAFGIWVFDDVEISHSARQIAEHGDEPSWSPDDSQIVFKRVGQKNRTGIFTMNADGSGQAQIVFPGPGERVDFPAWRRNP
jgi:dipeptidyl aminopeptidase/acylaminoacyl peptidase